MNLAESFNNLNPGQKRMALVVGGIVGILGVSYVFTSAMEKKAAEKPRADKPEVTVVSPERMTGVEQFSAQMDALSRQINELQNQTRELREQNEELKRRGVGEAVEAAPVEGEEEVVVNQEPVPPVSMDAPAEEPVPPLTPTTPVLEVPPALPPPIPTPPPVPAAAPAAPATPATASESEEQPKPRIRVLGEKGEVQDVQAAVAAASAPAPSEEKDAKVYIPSGAMFTGVLLNGLDAPTSSAAQKNPTPAVMRVKREAVLPNYAAIDVRECFLLAAGYGQLSTERALMRAETLSCVRSDGQVFETKLEAYIVGSDGKVGVPGRLVSKQGQLIAQSLMAGVFGGLGQALNRTRVPSLNINPAMGNSIYQSESVDSIFQSGISSGVATSANMIAKFYLDMAKETFPVVEVPAGEVGTVVVTRGANLPLKGSASLTRYVDTTDRAGVRASMNESQATPATSTQNPPAGVPEQKPQGFASIPDNTPAEQTLKAMEKSTREVQKIFNQGGSTFSNGTGW